MSANFQDDFTLWTITNHRGGYISITRSTENEIITLMITKEQIIYLVSVAARVIYSRRRVMRITYLARATQWWRRQVEGSVEVKPQRISPQ